MIAEMVSFKVKLPDTSFHMAVPQSKQWFMRDLALMDLCIWELDIRTLTARNEGSQ